MTAPLVKLVQWSGWAPQLPDRDHWLRWLRHGEMASDAQPRPDCKGVPAMLRRRCTLNARSCAETAMRVCEEAKIDLASTRLIFGSANGETSALGALLADLCVDQPLSPTAFTNSVHHVPTGYLSIASRQTALTRTVSAFEDTFTCSFMDMMALLTRKADLPVLLVIADEMPPEPFDQMLEAPPFPYGVAMLFEPLATQRAGALSFERATKPGSLSERHHSLPLFDFLRWYDGAEPQFRVKSAFGDVIWQKH